MATNANTQLILAFSSTTSTPNTTQLNFSIKLNARNYLAWKTQLLLLLNSLDLTGFIDGSKPTPSVTTMSTDDLPTPISNPEFQQWFKRDQMLLSWILSSISEEIFPYVTNVSSSFQA